MQQYVLVRDNDVIYGTKVTIDYEKKQLITEDNEVYYFPRMGEVVEISQPNSEGVIDVKTTTSSRYTWKLEPM